MRRQLLGPHKLVFLRAFLGGVQKQCLDNCLSYRGSVIDDVWKSFFIKASTSSRGLKTGLLDIFVIGKPVQM
jgi:hypothetical protein